MSKTSRNTNHPKKGSTIKVMPIQQIAAIQKIRENLHLRPRDLCLFVLGINTAYRANELLSITCGQVNYLAAGDVLDIKQTKTRKNRSTTLNKSAVQAIDYWLSKHPNPKNNSPLFLSRTGSALTVSTMTNMVKGWCADVDLRGNYGSHTLRKTWGYHQLRQNRETKPHMLLPILMQAYGHARQDQTLEYLCVQSDEVASLFMQVEL